MIPYVMCTKSHCPRANECYRLRALPDETQYQLYNDFIGLCNQDDGFQMFMKIKEGDLVVDLKPEIPEEINQNTDISDLNNANESQSIGI